VRGVKIRQRLSKYKEGFIFSGEANAHPCNIFLGEQAMKGAFYCAGLSISLIASSQTLAAPPAVTVGWTRATTGAPIPGWTTTVSEIVAGPPVWGYRIIGGVGAPRVDRVVIDLDVPCGAPKSSGAPTITPAKGPSQHYVLAYAIPSKNRTISIPCDAKRGGNVTFIMLSYLLGTSKLIARSAAAAVDGPK
jgi:hypothetical protein